MISSSLRIVPALRAWFTVAAIALLLAGCGGGGGGDDVRTIQPGTPAFQGTWQLTVAVDDVTSAPVAVEPAAVPTAEITAQLTTEAVASLVGTTSFQGYVVAVNGNTVRVTDDNTNYVLVINSFVASDYVGCGTCFPGTSVSFTLTVNYSESGEFEGLAVAPVTDTLVLKFVYTRTA